MNTSDWLEVEQRDAPLVLSFPHTGTDLPAPFDAGLVSSARARLDADWYIEQLYAFARELGATFVRTRISRTVIDVNRDPSGASLYPGQATTGLCPTETFDGVPLYESGREPDANSIDARKRTYLLPYHAALKAEIERLRMRHNKIVLYDCHSIRSNIPRLFDGELPHFNIGTNSGQSCDKRLEQAVSSAVTAPGYSQIVNGRFKGGYITRHFGSPANGIHAIQMELACRAYMPEPGGVTNESNWPQPWSDGHAAPTRDLLRRALSACLEFTRS